jgi:hypothetical protein
MYVLCVSVTKNPFQASSCANQSAGVRIELLKPEEPAMMVLYS